MKRYQVSRWSEVFSRPRPVRVRTVEAEDERAALRKVASATGLPIAVLFAREVEPLAPVGTRPLNGEKP